MKKLPFATAAGLGLLGGTAALLVSGGSRERRERRDLRERLQMAARGPVERFDPRTLDGLPGPARRYLLNALTPGAPLARGMILEMGGRIRLGGRWLPMTALEVLAPPYGFLWEAEAGRGLGRVSGADFYLAGRAGMHLRLWGMLPLPRAAETDPHLVRSARGRLAAETLWNPASLTPQRGTVWEAVDGQTARACFDIDGERFRLALTVDEDGRLRRLALDRWGDPESTGTWAAAPFGGEVLEERELHGIRLPSCLSAGWGFGGEAFEPFFEPVLVRVDPWW